MKQIVNVLIGVLIGMLLAGGIWLTARAPQGEGVTLLPPPTQQDIAVHVVGAVVRPDLYHLPRDSRVQDAVEAAGGFVAEADKMAINLAAYVEDGQMLDVPFVAGFEPVVAEVPSVLSDATPTGGGAELVNINFAGLDELDKLPGIGPTIAQRIIDYRELNGPFARIEDIQNVSGIGPATFDKLKDLITVDSP